MRIDPLISIGNRLAVWRSRRDMRALAIWVMVGLGVFLAIATFGALAGMEALAAQQTLRAILIADFLFALTVAAFVARRVAEMIAMRRHRSAGSQLHMRLVRLFTLIALIPTILVAVFATITLNFGLEGWFSERVRDVVSNSLEAAQAYEQEHRLTLEADAAELAYFLNRQKEVYPLLSGGQLRELLTRGQLQMQRALPRAYVIDGDAQIRARGERSYLFDFAPPTPQDIEEARKGAVVVIQDWENNEFRALLELDAFADRFLYVSREVDGEILGLLDETRETVRLYQQLEADRGRLLFEFALVYLGFALVVILAAMWTGLWFAERMARPVGKLASAAERVGRGDLDVRVRDTGGDDEIALLGRTFNEMTRQVKGQRDELISAHDETERRRRLFDSVLSGVTAGVIGVDGTGRIEVMNAAAAEMLGIDGEAAAGQELAVLVPEFQELIVRLNARKPGVVRADIGLHRAARDRELLARAASRFSDAGDLEGHVVSFDDVTDLVAAQRMAAWGDVARRIAHEVKNPLTPIQLSAERIRRKLGPLVGDQRAFLDQYTDVIVRQTNDLRRIVDEFSKFARMPAPERKALEINKLVSDAVVLQEAGRPDIVYALDMPDHAILAQLDATMIGQALTNLLKNAAEAIDEKNETDPDLVGEIRIALGAGDDCVTIDIQDNGAGLPDQPSRLFEPYVTHREKGTGLGLPIVKKIIEEHGGTLELVPAPPFSDGRKAGAWARIQLPQTGSGLADPDPESAHGHVDEEKNRITEKLRESMR